MKTSILTSISAICLGLRSLANVIPPSIRGPSRGAIFRRQNMTRAILGRVSSDESAIGQAGIGPAFARRESIDSTSFSFPIPFKRDAEKKNNDDQDRRDIHHLNHALFFKRFLCSFFECGLSRYSQEDFVRAGYPDWVRGRYTQMFDVAKVHRDFLDSAITSAGSERVRPCNVEFGDNDVRAFVDQSAALGTISASAFTGSMHHFNNKCSMLAVEARHAAWINSAVREENPSNGAFEMPLTLNHVATLLSRFVDFDSCPAENSDLLPEGYRPHPRLYLSPRLVPGEEAEISFPNSELGQGERFYAAFMAGAETIFARITERENGNDNGSGSRPEGNNRNSNDQFPRGWPSSDNRDGNRNKHAGDDHRDGNNHHDEDHNHDDGRKDENNHHSDNNRGDKDDGDRKDENDQNNVNRNDDNRNDDHHNEREKDHHRKDENDRNRKDGNNRNRKNENDHNRMDGNDHNRQDRNNLNPMDDNNHNRKDGNDHNRMDGNNRDLMDENNRNHKDDNDHNRKDGNDHNRNHENDHNDGDNRNGMHHGNNFNVHSRSNIASSGFNTRSDNNSNRRFFVEIPRDLATKGSIFVVVVKGRDNIGEVRVDEQSTVAGPAIVNFPFDAWNNPIGH